VINPMSLAGRAIIVTGAGQGIGFSVAKLISDLGGTPILVDRDSEKVAEAASTIGRDLLTLTGDVTDPQFAQAAVAATTARFGTISGLVNNAGITRTAMIEKMTFEQWSEVTSVHLTGSFLFLQAVGQHMVERFRAGEGRPGAIVNLSSDAGVQGTMGQINYGTAKAGILGMTMSAAREFARYGIRVNSVAFGVVETQMTETIRGEKLRETYLSRIPLGRWSTADEAAKPICFLLSDAASYITGQRLSANGGHQMNA